ncbi:hypothetical protein, partial [Undibacterium sp. CY21W]|uniref:hypothetical protein n=1 Tax=Undibacterium sp. CY21W TaxID=2762293 RepID=UPI00164A39AA
GLQQSQQKTLNQKTWCRRHHNTQQRQRSPAFKSSKIHQRRYIFCHANLAAPLPRLLPDPLERLFAPEKLVVLNPKIQIERRTRQSASQTDIEKMRRGARIACRLAYSKVSDGIKMMKSAAQQAEDRYFLQ